METNRAPKPICLLFCLLLSFIFFTHSDARKHVGFVRETKKNKIKAMKHISLLEKMMSQLNLVQPLDYSNTQPDGLSSPFTLPPYESLPPLSIPQNTPPFCLNPPNTPPNLPPSSPSYPDLSPPPGPIILPNPPDSSSNPNPPITVPNPNPNPPEPSYNPNPPDSSSNPNPPVTVPNPPVTVPNPPETFPSPGDSGYTPGPPGPITGPPYGPGPSTPTDSPTPSDGGTVPSPSSGFLPPVVFPPPLAPPAPSVAPTSAYWCVAKPTVPDPIIQEAMNYACGSGADCHSIQPNGPCFKPNTLWAHASYAFNSYWQRTKASGGSCTFGGTGMLVTVDPSFNGCHFDFF